MHHSDLKELLVSNTAGWGPVTEPLLGDFADTTICDDADFEAFFIDWHPTVRRWAMQHYGASYADEIAQETLSRAFVHFRELRHAVPWPWLVTVARNVACDLHRSASRCTDAGPTELERPDPAPGPEDVAIRTETSLTLRRAVLAMPPSQRELLAMAVERGMSIADMAEELGTTQGAIRVRLHRARKALGCLYEKTSHLALAPVAGLGWALRHLRRATQPAASTMAPATALMMATAVVTVGAVAVGSAPVHVSSGRAHTVTLSAQHRHAASGAHVHHSASSAASFARAVHRVTRAAQPTAGGTGSTAAGAAGPVTANAHVAKDPTKPGSVEQHNITLRSPAGDTHVTGHIIRNPGEGIACDRAALFC